MTERNPMKIMWNREKIAWGVLKTLLADDYCSEVDTPDSCFHWKGRDEVW